MGNAIQEVCVFVHFFLEEDDKALAGLFLKEEDHALDQEHSYLVNKRTRGKNTLNIFQPSHIMWPFCYSS